MKTIFITSLHGILLGLAAIAAAEESTVPTNNVPHEPNGYGQSGYRIMINPDTGEILAPTRQFRPSMHLSIDEANAMSTSHDGLYEKRLPGGGYAVNLQGRFQSSLFATVDKAGNVITTHEQPVNDPEAGQVSTSSKE